MVITKFQALVKPSANLHRAGVDLDAAPRRMVLCAFASPVHDCQMFSVLVSGDGDLGPYAVVTLRMSGDDVRDYLNVGEHFDLWLGTDVAEGVITRRLYV